MSIQPISKFKLIADFYLLLANTFLPDYRIIIFYQEQK
jgi:hypothetical protein